MTGEELMDELGVIDIDRQRAITQYDLQMWVLTALFTVSVLISMLTIPLSIMLGVAVIFSYWYVTKEHKKSLLIYEKEKNASARRFTDYRITKEREKKANPKNLIDLHGVVKYKAHFDACLTQASVDETFKRYYTYTSKNFEELQGAYDRASRRVQ